MYGFVKCLLLGSWTEREFRKRTQVTQNTSRVCVRDWDLI